MDYQRIVKQPSKTMHSTMSRLNRLQLIKMDHASFEEKKPTLKIVIKKTKGTKRIKTTDTEGNRETSYHCGGDQRSK